MDKRVVHLLSVVCVLVFVTGGCTDQQSAGPDIGTDVSDITGADQQRSRSFFDDPPRFFGKTSP